MEPEESLVIYERQGHVARIRLNRPRALNAMNLAMMAQLAQAAARLERDDEAWVAVLSGEGKAFCAGGDLKESLALLETPGASVYDLAEKGLAAVEAIASGRKPVIAAVHGFCMAGGLLLANACALIVTGEATVFGMPEATVGMPTLGYFDLWKTIGPRNLLEMALTGRPIPAQRALEMGLVNRVVAEERVVEEGLALAEAIASNSPLSVSGHLEAIRYSVKYDAEALRDLRRHLWDKVVFSEDLREGLTAFREKRPPHWRNR